MTINSLKNYYRLRTLSNLEIALSNRLYVDKQVLPWRPLYLNLGQLFNSYVWVQSSGLLPKYATCLLQIGRWHSLSSNQSRKNPSKVCLGHVTHVPQIWTDTRDPSRNLSHKASPPFFSLRCLHLNDLPRHPTLPRSRWNWTRMERRNILAQHRQSPRINVKVHRKPLCDHKYTSTMLAGSKPSMAYPCEENHWTVDWIQGIFQIEKNNNGRTTVCGVLTVTDEQGKIATCSLHPSENPACCQWRLLSRTSVRQRS